MQAELETDNCTLPETSRMVYRIGINVGDVIANGDDLLGDGVNVAARLEALAPPGGIVISRTVRDQIRDKMNVELNDLKEVHVKNIARPVHAFQIIREGEAKMARPTGMWRKFAQAGVLIAVALVGMKSGFWLTPTRRL